MGALPKTTPLAEFPGLEYFGNAPGRNVTIERRGRGQTNPTGTTVAGNAIGTNAFSILTLDSQFGPGKAVFIHDLRGWFDPMGDTAGKLQITGVQLELQCPNGPNPGYEFGFPIGLLTNPTLGSTISLVNDFLFTWYDGAIISGNAGGGWGPPPAPLVAVISVNVNNIDTAAHSFKARLIGTWRILSGVLDQ
jgi:hypothetical protein